MRGFTAQLGAAWVLGAVFCLFSSGSAFGLVLHPGDEDPPPLRPLDAAVGRWVTNGSCVAVGPNHVITTRHQNWLSNKPVWIGGVEYRTAEIFDHSEADLRAVRIATPEGQNADLTYYIPPYTDTGERYETLVIGGYGLGRGSELKTPFDVTYGYNWAGAANDTLRWGANRIEGFNHTNDGDYSTDVITADFDGPDGSAYRAHETAPAAWDSGGGWFIDVSGSGDWRVAGLTRAAQHASVNQSWFKNNVTGLPDPDYLDAVRVSSYAGWVNGVLNPSLWSADASGNWADPANWTPGVPNAANTWAVLGDAIAADRTVTLDTAVTIGTLRIDSGNSYTLQGDGPLIFNVTGNPAAIEVNRQKKSAFHGAHTVSVPITLAVPLILNTRSTGDLTLAGVISGVEHITKRGEGTVVLAAANAFFGGLTVEEGAVRATNPGALGSGEVVLDGGSLDLRSDTDATFAGVVSAKTSTAVHVESAGGGAGRTLSVHQFTMQNNETLTVTGADDYCLGVSDMTIFSGASGLVTVDTASANLALAGGLTRPGGAIGKTGPGTMAIGGPQAYGSGTTMNVQGGTVRFDSDAGPNGQDNLTINVTDAGAAVQFGATQHLARLDVADGAAQILTGAGSMVVTEALSIDETDSYLDLADGAMILDYTGPSPLPQVTDWLRSGCNQGDGYWDGNGIASSVAAACNRLITAVGVLDNGDPQFGGRDSFLGEDVDATSILVRHTKCGDADLDGIITSHDYDRIDSNWLRWKYDGTIPDGGFRWAVGDFNHDGIINSHDYDLIDRAWLIQQYQPPAEAGSSGSVAVATPEWTDLVIDPPPTFGTLPEPATVALLGLGLLGLTVRRRFG